MSSRAPLAIVGMSCRFPGADSVDQFWELLRTGRDAIAEVPPDRWTLEDLDVDDQLKVGARWGGFVSDVDRFDAGFFNISPREATCLDPQQRIFLELAWEALESAGQIPSELSGGNTGVFVGASTFDYALRQLRGPSSDMYATIGSILSMVANRVSYTLDLHGPSLCIDTACSASLVALLQACRSIWSGAIDNALIGGVNLLLNPALTLSFCRGGFMASDGRCKTFDARANGYVRGEGAGVLFVRRLDEAQRRGERVFALIRGGAVNHDGLTNGISAPNLGAQVSLLRSAFADAEVRPEDIQYIEVHGTGTALGDSIEARALGRALGGASTTPPWVVGSVKTNIGHLEPAAGIAGLIKTVLSLHHRTIPPSLHYETPNPRIDFERLRLRVPTESEPWVRSGRARIGGVSSFGIGGTNAHVIIEEAPDAEEAPEAVPALPFSRSAELVVLSAKVPEALDEAAARLRAHIEKHPEASLGDLAYSLATTRTHHEHRLALSVRSREELCEALSGASRGALSKGSSRARVSVNRPKVVFVFPGQGSQWVGMGRELLEEDAIFRKTMEECDRAIFAETSWSLLAELKSGHESSRLEQIDVVQPALFAIAVSLAALWRSWGIEPSVVVGQSQGEVAAACVAGALSLADGAAIICRRSRLLRRIVGHGEMALVQVPLAEAQAAIAGYERELSVAVINSRRSTVLSGTPSAMAAVLSKLEAKGVYCKRVKVDYASHSPQIDSLRAELLSSLGEVSSVAARVPMRSTVTAAWVGEGELDGEYWANNLRQPVRLAEVVEGLLADGHQVFVEMSAHPVLSVALEELRGESAAEGMVVGSLVRERPERASLLDALGALYAHGSVVDWKALFPRGGRLVELPTYAWQRQRYWIDSAELGARVGERTGHPLLGVRLVIASTETVYESVLSQAEQPWIYDHRVAGSALVPGAALAELVRAAAEQRFAGEPVEVTSLVFQAPLALPERGGRRVQVVVIEAADHVRVQVHSQPANQSFSSAWTVHASGEGRRASPSEPARLDLSEARGRCTAPVDVEGMYASYAALGIGYGAAFQGVRRLLRGPGEALAEVVLPPEAGTADGYGIHPALLDAAFQGAMGVAEATGLHLPFAIDRLVVHQPGATVAHVHMRRRDAKNITESAAFAVDVTLTDAQGQVLVEVGRLRARPAEAQAVGRSSASSASGASGASGAGDALYRVEWRVMETPAPSVLATGRWLVVAGAGDPVACAIVERVRAGGAPCTQTDWARLGKALPAEQVVVVCDDDGEPSEAALRGATECLAVVQALVGKTPAPRLWLVTRGAVAVTPEEAPAVASSSRWGLGRTVMAEHPELRCTLVDVERNADAAERVLGELCIGDDESQVAWRGDERHVARLVRAPSAMNLSTENYALESAAKGTLDNLALVPARRRKPGPGEVEISVLASGVNFRDVFAAMGLSAQAGKEGSLREPLGSECAGVVVAVGPFVSRFAVGDSVMALASGGFQRFVTVDTRLVAEVPAGLSYEQAATIPSVFLTAWYALHDLAGLKAGERLLVHAAAGGVGMAAVQIAHWIGAAVLGTASASKWEVVRSLGVEHVASSRDLSFVEAFRAATNGAGVDVVLNALPGEFVDASLSLLAEGGRFVEMGKTDIRDASAVSATHPGVSYRAFDLLEAGPDRLAEMFRAIVEGFAKGRLTSLPVRTFPVTEAEAAFRFMAQARHVGKLALMAPRGLRTDGTVLITGGLGSLGLHVAQWLVGRGVKHLVLTGRRGKETPGAGEAVAELERLGAHVTVAAVDVTSRESVGAVLNAISPAYPLRGVIHAAGVLDDGVLSGQTVERFARVMSPKVLGAWHLDALTREADLDFFVLFSSVAGTFGSAGQGPYAAGNAFLDALASQRQAQGRPGQSLAWGLWTDASDERGAGLASGMSSALRTRIARQGMKALSSTEGLTLFDEALRRPEAQLVVVPLDLRAMGKDLGGAVPPLWRALVRAPHRAAAAHGGWAREVETLPPARRLETVLETVRAEVARTLALASPARVEPDQPLRELGLDSLMAVELRNRLGRRTGGTLPATLAFDYPTPAAIARYLVDELFGLAEPQAATTPSGSRGRADEPIAIVGIGCRYPGGVSDPDSFWRLLDGGVDAVKEIPRDRWDVDAWYDADPDAAGKMTTRWGGFLEGGLDRFDPGFFGISPREAVSVDPQERLLLETSWEALERAGIGIDRLMGSDTGVYVGICGNDYQVRTMQDPSAIDAYSLLGTTHSAMVGRLSYFLGLKGPNMPIDTACSSSLVAVHLACQALRTGECSLALAGGVNVLLQPEVTVSLSRLRALSPTGRCHAFSADADGYVRAEGAGVVVLERLSDARRNGHPILALIRGSAVNQDGRSNGLTAPNGPSQEMVIREALQRGGIAASSVSYLECHGTGTPLGDPIEVQAAAAVLGEGRDADSPLMLGSLKSNVGHTEGAAGIGGLIKTVLSLRHERIPKTLHFEAPNPHIPWDDLPVKVAAEAIAWTRTSPRAPRRAGVSSFGFSGTNAHVVLEEAPSETAARVATTNAARSAELVVLSAKTSEALDRAAARLRSHLEAQPEESLADVAYSLATTRTHHAHRLALSVKSRQELARGLESALEGKTPAGGARGEVQPGKLAWLFTGQGAQTLGMGRGLYAEWPVFRAALDAAWAALDVHLPAPLREVMWAEPEADNAHELHQTLYAQPALFAFEIALAALWRSWGIEPDFLAGHSIGELSAAYVAGVFSLEDAARLVTARARLMQALPPGGAMVAIAAPEATVAAAVAPHATSVSIAAVNAPDSVVISGTESVVLAIAERFARQGLRTKRLEVSHAFHSPSMDSMLDDFRVVAESVTFRAPERPLVSHLTGEVGGAELSTAEYWVRHARHAVRFSVGVQALHAAGVKRYLELGPKPTLLGLVPSCLAHDEEGDVTLVASLRPERPEAEAVREALGHLYAQGGSVDWTGLFPEGARRVELPTYPWQRERHWIEGATAPGAAEAHDVSSSLYRVDWLEEPSSPGPATALRGRWVIVGSHEDAAGHALAERLIAAGASCIQVEPERLTEALPADHVIGLWSHRPDLDTPDASLRVATEGLTVIQALAKQRDAPRLWWVTTGAAEVLPGEPASAPLASLWGLALAVIYEHPELRCRIVDLERGADALRPLLEELGIDDDEQEVAWRRGRRHVARLVQAPTHDPSTRKLRIDGTVLITGGLGTLGLHVARWFALQGVRHLVLTGRRGKDTPGAAAAIAELEARGCRVTVSAVDVADAAALASVFEAIPIEVPLRGVVHMAAVADPGRLVDQSAERFARVMAPKAMGALHLDALTRGLDLDFFVLFSSIASTLSEAAAGSGAYAPANAFLNALASRRRAEGLPAQSLAWGLWADPSSRLKGVERVLTGVGLGRALSLSRGLALLEAALRRPESKLVPMNIDAGELRRRFGDAVPSLWRALVTPEVREASGRGSSALTPTREAMLETVRAEAARVLSLPGASAVAADRPLSELGLDSLMAVELRNALAKRIGTSLPTTLAFDYPTPAAITKYLIRKLSVVDVAATAPETPRLVDEPIAIVGIGCRYPGGVTDPKSFWRLLEEGIDAVSEVPRERWDIDAFYDPDPEAPGKMVTRSGGFIRDIDRFDAGFFAIAPREAVNLDPQQRLLLETSWEALEHAGIAPDQLEGTSTGVFVGLSGQEYQALSGGGFEQMDGYALTGSITSIASGRISYVLGLQGPSMTVDTACSSSLVSIHLACQALRSGECSLALAGGAALTLTPNPSIAFSRLRGLALDGRCKSFSAAADGMGFSEGSAMLVCERLSDATRNGHTVLALIRGSAVNQDGRSQGLTAPNGPSQQAVIRRALAQAGVRPSEVQYVECHGTGTPLGDPIEVQALGSVMSEGHDVEHPVVVGSVKSNLGHTQAAAGAAGIIKVVLALQHGLIPKSLHFDTPSPHIPWDELPVKVASEAVAWPRGGERRIAGVSSFGISGTNAHVVLEEAPRPEVEAALGPPARAAELVVVSAKTPAALDDAVVRLREHLERQPEQALEQIAFSLATRRMHHEHRLSVLARTRSGLVDTLDALARGETPAGAVRGSLSPSSGRLAWLFTGQGAQAPGMGRDLAAEWPVFREALEQSFATLDPHLDVPLRDVMWADAGTPLAARLDQTEYTQPALFALEVALAALWRSWGVEPDLLAGHSIGELAAAHVAGVFSLEDAARLVAARGRLMQALPTGGAMVSLAAPEGDVAAAVAAHAASVSLAAINGPRSVVISGASASVLAIAERFATQGVRTKRLVVSHAFHSPLMKPMLEDLRRVAESVTYLSAEVPLVSNVTGAMAGPEIATADYWVNHVRAAVRFGDGVRALYEAGVTRFLELGPKATLLGLVPESLPSDSEPTLLASLRSERPEPEAALEALGGHHAQGGRVDWNGVFPAGMRHVELPTYPWQRERYWLEASSSRARAGEATGHPLLGARVGMAGADAAYEASLSLGEHPWLGDHRVAGQVLVPGAGLTELLRAAAENRFEEPAEVLSLVLQTPLLVPDQGARRVQVVLTEEDNRTEAKLYSQPAEAKTGSAWTLHATAEVRRSASRFPSPLDLAALRARCTERVDVAQAYEGFAATGLRYGPSFRGMRALLLGSREALAEVALPASVEGGEEYGVHPALLDASFHALAALTTGADGLYLPFAIDRVAVHQAGATAAWAYVRRTDDGESIAADVTLADAQGQVLVEVLGLRLERADSTARKPTDAAQSAVSNAVYRVEWPMVATPARDAPPAGRWLVVAADGDAMAETVTEQVRAAGASSTRTTFARLGDALPAEHVVYVCSDDGCAPEAALRVAVEGLALVQALATQTPPPRLWMVTRGAVAVRPEEAPASSSSLWGFGRTVMAEHPELRCTLVDVEASTDAGECVLGQLCAGDDESQVAWRNGKRHVARLVRAPETAVPATENYALEAKRTGMLDQLALAPARRRAPEVGEVEIAVSASGVNFRDVLNALGMYPGDAGPLGGECAGVIAAVGPGVVGLALGDAVMALAAGSFQRFVTVDARLVAKVPPGLSMEQAATVPLVFLTAWYALHDLAGLKAGERLLVHAAAGGVGMAAVQLAQWIGAEVLGTASPSKWEVVRSLGVEQVASSRDVGFVETFRTATRGGGVDVVLNALSGEFVDASLSLLRDGGRFLEMGKTDIRDAAAVSAKRPAIRYRPFDLVEAGPDRIAEMFGAIAAGFATGRLKPLPVRAFPVTDAEAAFRFMAQARHVGKLALLPPRARRGDGTVLITGGLGALGLHVARWLAGRGAKHLVLTGRRGRETPGALAAIAELEALGAQVTVAPIDVADRDALAAALKAIPPTLPLRGVVHAAGVLDDGVLAGQSAERFARVMSPKVDGASHLDTLTREADLDFFVLFSSLAGTLGAAGQGSYAAANAFVDGLAARRRARGLPAQSLAWGPWAEGGMAASLDAALQARIARQGMNTLSPAEGIALLEGVLDRREADLVLVPLDLRSIGRMFGGAVPPLWRALVRAPRRAAAAEGAWAEELAALPSARRLEAVLEAVRAEVARVLSLAGSDRVDTNRPLRELGLDSLMAVELRNALGKRVGTTLPATLAFDYPTPAAIAKHLVETILGFKPSTIAKNDAPELAPSDLNIEYLSQLSTEQTIAELQAEFDVLMKELDSPT